MAGTHPQNPLTIWEISVSAISASLALSTSQGRVLSKNSGMVELVCGWLRASSQLLQWVNVMAGVKGRIFSASSDVEGMWEPCRAVPVSGLEVHVGFAWWPAAIICRGHGWGKGKTLQPSAWSGGGVRVLFPSLTSHRLTRCMNHGASTCWIATDTSCTLSHYGLIYTEQVTEQETVTRTLVMFVWPYIVLCTSLHRTWMSSWKKQWQALTLLVYTGRAGTVESKGRSEIDEHLSVDTDQVH